MANLLKDHKFNEYCKLLKVTDQPPSDPDRRVIEKAFRRLALKTHPDKVRCSLKFKNKFKINTLGATEKTTEF